jgi:hypothetical protein
MQDKYQIYIYVKGIKTGNAKLFTLCRAWLRPKVICCGVYGIQLKPLVVGCV